MRSVFCSALLTCSVVFLIACGSSVETKPVDIAAGDTCVFCKQPITEKRYAAEFVTKDGFIRKFDDIGCMSQHANKMKKQNIAAYYIVDYPSGQWMKGEEGVYLKSKHFKTPGGSGILGYRDKAKADGITSQAQYEAQMVQFADLFR